MSSHYHGKNNHLFNFHTPAEDPKFTDLIFGSTYARARLFDSRFSDPRYGLKLTEVNSRPLKMFLKANFKLVVKTI